MSDKLYDFHIIFVKMAEPRDQISADHEKLSQDQIKEYEEIRELREIVMEVQARPQVFFSTT